MKVDKAKTPSARRASSAAANSNGALPDRETGTVKRVLMLLSALVDSPGESLSTIAARLNLPRSTVHRLLAMLRTSDFAMQQTDGSFAAGAELYRLAGRLKATLPYARFAQPLLQQLSDHFKETSILAILERTQLKMFYASTASPADPMRYNIMLNRLEPLVWGATARALLAYLTKDEIEQAFERKERAPVDSRLPSRGELNRALTEIRKQGFAVTHSHRTRGAVGVAVPFFDASGEVIGDFGFLIPEFRFGHHSLPALVDALGAAAATLSKQLGLARA